MEFPFVPFKSAFFTIVLNQSTLRETLSFRAVVVKPYSVVVPSAFGIGRPARFRRAASA